MGILTVYEKLKSERLDKLMKTTTITGWPFGLATRNVIHSRLYQCQWKIV